ncbi:Mg2+ transporter protein, CorA-like [Rhodopseudomonas palustris HaA2]|uniref:Mg2+ transporter protein, CorA-like n=1 Tax=Rhodopseudomonas palustris (strain HaA2) TaxID=316058 RepID=Q2IZB6_RHOP2|nr:transporter [Rhodopseudomonas palustris]ABD06444.1 Mg2+ transporter protein, CorA-like [Rhodopseudomonas palustris HaA2]
MTDAPRCDPAIPGLVWGFSFGPDGTPQSLPDDAPLGFERHGRYWLHFNLADSRAHQSLAEIELPAPVRTLLQSRDTYQQMHSLDGCVYGVIADLMRDIADVTEDTGFLRFVMTEQLLITARYQALCAVDTARRALERGHRVESCAALFEMIVHNVADAMEKIADDVFETLDKIEEKLLSDDTDDLRQGLGRVRRTCVRLHRHLSGLRIVLHRFDRNDSADLAPALRPRAGKLAQRLDGLDHSVVEMRERSRLLQEELHLKIEEQGNGNLRVLSMLTALLMPPTLVSGMFGMNLRGLPFAEGDGGFVLALLAMAMSSFGAWLLMKRIGLIR